MKRWHVVREVFTRGQWEERPLPFERRVFKFRQDAEAIAQYLGALNDCHPRNQRYTVKRRPLK